MLSLRDTDLEVTQLPCTNNSVFNLPLKISRVADVLTCSDSPFHTMGAEKQKADWAVFSLQTGTLSIKWDSDRYNNIKYNNYKFQSISRHAGRNVCCSITKLYTDTHCLITGSSFISNLKYKYRVIQTYSTWNLIYTNLTKIRNHRLQFCSNCAEFLYPMNRNIICLLGTGKK